MASDFARVAAVSVRVHLGDVEANRREIAARMRELAAQVSGEINDRFPKLQLNCKVSRIYRDARRLHGQGPYKDHLWFVLRPMATAADTEPGFYFEAAPEHYSYGMGSKQHLGHRHAADTDTFHAQHLEVDAVAHKDDLGRK